MVRVHAPEESLRATLGMRPVGPLRLALSAAAGVGLCPALSTVDDLVAKRWPYDDPEAAREHAEAPRVVDARGARPRRVRRHPAGAGGLLPRPPLRRARWPRDRSRRRGARAVATALLFAVFSLDWRSMPTALVLGLALGWLRARSGSLVAPAVAHLAFWSVQGIPILARDGPRRGLHVPRSVDCRRRRDGRPRAGPVLAGTRAALTKAGVTFLDTKREAAKPPSRQREKLRLRSWWPLVLGRSRRRWSNDLRQCAKAGARREFEPSR